MTIRFEIAYLREFTIESVSQFLIVVSAMLLDSCGVGAVRSQNLISSVDVILLYQLLLVLIEIFSVGYSLLKSLISEASQEVLLQVRGRSGRGPVMQVLKL